MLTLEIKVYGFIVFYSLEGVKGRGRARGGGGGLWRRGRMLLTRVNVFSVGRDLRVCLGWERAIIFYNSKRLTSLQDIGCVGQALASVKYVYIINHKVNKVN